MIAAILSLLGSSAVGTLLGGIFAFLNRKTDLAMKQIDLSHEKDKWAQDLLVKAADKDYMLAEAGTKKDIAVVETDGAIETARMAAIAAVQATDKIDPEEIKAAGSLGWLLVIADVSTRLVRPVATVILAGTAIYINIQLISKLQDTWASYTAAQQYDAAMQAFSWITGQAAAVLSFWFVSRGTPSK